MITHRERVLQIKWSISKGRFTQGYRIASLREHGEVKARCHGGGYDMRGTVFAEWLEKEFQSRLVKIGSRMSYQRHKNGDTRRNEAGNNLYGGTFDRGKRHVALDGGCGFSSIQRIAEAIGLTVRSIDGGKSEDIILVVDTLHPPRFIHQAASHEPVRA